LGQSMSQRGWALFGSMCVIWGVPYLLIKVAVRVRASQQGWWIGFALVLAGSVLATRRTTPGAAATGAAALDAGSVSG